MHAIEEIFSKLARTRIGHLNTKYEDRLARFLRSLQKSGEIGGPPQGLTVEQILHILMRVAEGRKHDQGCSDRPVREVGCKVSAVLHRTVDSDSFLEVNSNIPSTVFLKFKRAWPTPNLCPLWSTCAAATVWMMFCVYCAG